MVGGGVEDEGEAARADGAEAPQQLRDDAEPRQDEAVQVARADVLVERGQACKQEKQEGNFKIRLWHRDIKFCDCHGQCLRL